MEKINILGAHVSNVTASEAADIILHRTKNKETTRVFTPNSEIIENFRKDPKMLEILNSAELLTPDGIGVVIGSKILGTPLKERAAGFDIANLLLDRARKDGLTFYFFGSKEEVGKLAKENVEKMYPGVKIVGTHSGYFSENDDIASIIVEANPDIIFVCLGAGKQEKWIYDNAPRLSGKALLGIGGSLDVFAGTVKRAPDIFIKLNLEWFYRLIKQPQRFIRMLALPRFILSVTDYRLKHGKGKSL